MKFIGFNFTKISVEKLENSMKPSAKDVKISSKVDVSSIEKADADIFKGKDEIFVVKFDYSVNYAPEFANISLQGNVLVSLEPKQAKSLISDWKDKKIPEEVQLPLFNLILKKSNIKSLQLEDEMNLPIHIPLQRLTKK